MVYGNFREILDINKITILLITHVSSLKIISNNHVKNENI